MWINVQKLLMLFGLLSLVALSCVPNQDAGGSRRSSRTNSSGGGTAPGPTPNPPVFESANEVFWYSGESSFENIITVNEDIATVIYLRGNSINNFLAASLDGVNLNENRTYCLVASYNSSGAQRNYRARAVPISFFNFTTSTKERLLRIDLPDADSSVSTCGGNAFNITTTVDAASTVGNINSAFSLPTLCPTCVGIISSTDVSLYLANSTTISTNDRIPESTLNLNDLILRVDTQSGSSTQQGSCTDAACSAKGFDCCLDGQCVNDGNLRPNASTQPDFTQALVDVANNPNNFINWPSIYFVCGSTPPDPIPTPTPFPDAESTAAARFQELVQDFNCLEEGKKAFPDFGGNNVCAPDFNQTSYEAVRSKVWAYCGCEADPFPTDPDDPRCPDFGLEATRDLNDNIIDVTCFTPEPPAQPTPFQSLSLSVNTRSSPHRFYRGDTGESVDDITTLDSTVLPEGTPFQYTDNSSKTGPDCSGDNTGASTAECRYNLNSIFGQFNVTLDQSRPATVVNLDFDQAYIISSISGFHTPCPTCVADYWFQSFTAYPDSQQGVGLEALGYQTNRQTFGNNNPRGNWEDTRFGRACFLPPTMIPLSHKRSGNVNAQRQNRLLTQTALWINGYQRDWFGFNKGSLIGSFDGVKWFGIGKNRRVISDTGKLFLAINSPFADLTDPSDFIVQVVLDQGNSVAPLNDYDPNFEPDAPEQNSAASCQYWHQCNTDTDCITKLGWEYMCIDTNNYRSRWPKFDVNADEVADSEFESATFSRLIQGGMPSGNRKRCVYRGAGAMCKRDYTSGLLDNRKKLFACAPNFHCASLDAAEFNSRVVRTPNTQTSIIYGMETDILGRPLNYAEGNEELPNVVKENLRYNGELYTTQTSDLGLCRPGKRSTSSNALQQHQDDDSGGRMDYIGQVGTCNSSGNGDARVQACPLIQREADLLTEQGDLILATDPVVGSNAALDVAVRNGLLTTQNACGYESEFTNADGLLTNTFAQIEADPIRLINSLVTPAIAQDACLRRAGSVCHTDLDCGPNRLHESLAFALSRDEFGGTDAERQYWQESLICGQAAEKPLPGSEDYFDYDMSLNRCCREVGKDFSMHTQFNLNGGADPNNELLNVLAFPHNNPNATGRYSRYVAAGAEDNPAANATSTPYAQAPFVDVAGRRIPRAFQWKTFNDTGTSNCCGGGWIRKFADGTTNWDDPGRLRLNPLNFQCLNYHREDADFSDPLNYFTYEQNLSRDIDRYCLSPLENGCAQIEFPPPTGDGSITPPIRRQSFQIDLDPGNPFTGRVGVYAVLDTTPANTPSSGGAVGMSALNFDVPFEPLPFANPIAIDDDPLDGIDRFTYFFSQDEYFGVSFYVPSYVGYRAARALDPLGITNNIRGVRFTYFREDGTNLGTTSPLDCSAGPGGIGLSDCDGDAATTTLDVCDMDENPERDLGDNQFCFVEVDAGTGLVFHARPDTTLLDDQGTADPADDIPWAYATIQISFNLQGGPAFTYNSGQNPNETEGMFTGNELYYLTKLGRLELLGVPQIVIEPLWCNTNRDKLVPGIFNDYQTREQFRTGVGISPAAIGMDENLNILENGRPLIAMYDERYSSGVTSTANYNLGNDEANFYDFNGVTWNDQNEKFVFQTNDLNQSILTPPPIFSEDEFRCCVKLGEAASEDAKCCSGFRDTGGLCKLPEGADLHVYFNKFISGEGIGEDLPDGGLLESDFIPETGEPKISDTVLSKLRSLGEAFCANGEVRGGAAFGFFFPEPNNGAFQHREAQNDINAARVYSIIDSTRDFDPESESGTSPFLNGFRWDHHLYCGPPAN